MSAVLTIETSTDAASIALAIDSVIVEEQSFASDRRHNSLLFQPLEKILKKYNSPVLSAILVGSGPGSYSGTRVGIAAAQGAAIISGAKAISVPSILATREASEAGKCIAMGDARRGSYWLAEIENGQLSSGPTLTDEKGLDTAISNANKTGIPYFCMEKIRGKEITVSQPSATGIWQAWQSATQETRDSWTAQIPQPIYLKPPHITPSKKKTQFT